MSRSTSRIGRTLVLSGLLLFRGPFLADPVGAQTITLDFNSLPSAQGWTYVSDGAPETSIFLVSGGILMQNTVASPYTIEWYELLGVVDPALPFTIEARARVLQHSGGDPATNAFGFCLDASTGNEEFAVGLSTDKISDALHNQVPFDNTLFHNYRLAVRPGVGYELFVDGNLIATGPPRTVDIGPNRLLLGDCTRGRGALAEVTRFVFTQVLEVAIDIKPGSDPNSINLSAAGVIPVAILSTAGFDATAVNPETVGLAGASIKMVGKSGKYLCSPEDVTGDGLIDLVCQVNTAQFMIEEGSSIAVLEAKTFGGLPIRGQDAIRIVRDK
jgi:hypothetical protein